MLIVFRIISRGESEKSLKCIKVKKHFFALTPWYVTKKRADRISEYGSRLNVSDKLTFIIYL